MSITQALGQHYQMIGGPLHGKIRYILNGEGSYSWWLSDGTSHLEGRITEHRYYRTNMIQEGFLLPVFIHRQCPVRAASEYLLRVENVFEIMSECIGWYPIAARRQWNRSRRATR